MKKIALSLCSLSFCSTGFAAGPVHARLCAYASGRLPSLFQSVEECTKQTELETDSDGHAALTILSCETNELTTFWIDSDTLDIFQTNQTPDGLCH